MKPTLLGVLQNFITKMARQCGPSGKPNNIDGQPLAGILPEHFIKQMLPLVLHDLMGPPSGDRIPVDITAIARAALIISRLVIQLNKVPYNSIEPSGIASAIKCKRQ